jgi:hypothetical protein
VNSRHAWLLAVVGLVCAAPAQASDGSATESYIRAEHTLAQYGAVRLATAHELLEGVLFKTKSECPHAAAESPENSESSQLSDEVIGEMVIAAYKASAPEIHVFAATVAHSQWSSSSLTHAVHVYARKLNAISRLVPPDLCADARAWAASGYHTVPAATVRFDHQFMPNWVAYAELQPGLRRFESAADAALLHSTIRLEGRISDFEAEAVEMWGQIMNTLDLNPE